MNHPKYEGFLQREYEAVMRRMTALAEEGVKHGLSPEEAARRVTEHRMDRMIGSDAILKPMREQFQSALIKRLAMRGYDGTVTR